MEKRKGKEKKRKERKKKGNFSFLCTNLSLFLFSLSLSVTASSPFFWIRKKRKKKKKKFLLGGWGEGGQRKTATGDTRSPPRPTTFSRRIIMDFIFGVMGRGRRGRGGEWRCGGWGKEVGVVEGRRYRDIYRIIFFRKRKRFGGRCNTTTFRGEIN